MVLTHRRVLCNTAPFQEDRNHFHLENPSFSTPCRLLVHYITSLKTIIIISTFRISSRFYTYCSLLPPESQLLQEIHVRVFVFVFVYLQAFLLRTVAPQRMEDSASVHTSNSVWCNTLIGSFKFFK
jgi:hypothetical protein